MHVQHVCRIGFVLIGGGSERLVRQACDRSVDQNCVEPRVGLVRSSVTGNQLRCRVGNDRHDAPAVIEFPKTDTLRCTTASP